MPATEKNEGPPEMRHEYDPVSMTESLVSADAPTATGVAQVEVVAPATLPEGYTFEAVVGSQTVTVSVPAGGVEEGQKFCAAIQGGTDDGDVNLAALARPRVNVPVGNWRDSWYDCFRFGCCHQLFGLSYCCTPIPMAQVMTRMKLDWLGNEGNAHSVARTFWIVLAIFVLYILLNPLESFTPWPGTTLGTMRNLLEYLPVIADARSFPNHWVVVYAWVNFCFGLVFLVYVVYVMTKTRRYLRTKYAIPEVYCASGCEDFCCSLFCPCCTVAHMARHTADYETYAATCCTATGLPPHVPSIV